MEVNTAQSILDKIFPTWVSELKPIVKEVSSLDIKLKIQAKESILRPGDIVSGQAMLALVDTAMVMGVIAAIGELKPTATVNLNASFLKPLAAKEFIVQAKVIRKGRTMAFTEARIYPAELDENSCCFSATGTYALPA